MRQNSYYHSGRKGYLQIDFLFAITAFLIFFYTVFTLYEQNFNGLENSIEIDTIQVDAKDICYMLISSQGIPSTWNNSIGSFNAVGLKGDNNILDITKIRTFTNQSNYFTILNSFNISSFVYVNISSLQNSSSFVFGSKSEEVSMKGTYTCFKPLWGQNHAAKVYVEVWR